MRAEESRVLVVAPVGQDAEAMAGMLRSEGVMAEACAGAEECLEGLEAGAGAVLLTEEALELPGAEALLESFGRQPAWSELPLIILTSGGESRFERLLEIAAERAGAVTLLERPMRAGTLLHSVQVALRSRRRQYEVRDLLAERERAAEVLRESQERVKLAMNVARLFAFEWNPVTDFVRRDGNAAAVLGVDFSEETGAAFFSRIHPEDRERFVGMASSLSPGRDSYKTEYRILRPDGKEAVLEESGRGYFDAGGRLIRLIGMTADITERKRADEALRESHERLKRVVETQTVGVMFWDLSTGCLVDANETFLSLMGYSRSEVEARVLTWEKLTPPEYLEVSREEVRKFLSTGRVGPYEKEYFRKDGTRVWLLFAGSSLGKNECVEFCVDISDRKKAEAALRQANERLNYHVQNTPLAVVEFDAELKVCAWSGGAERMFGWKSAEVLGRRMWEIGWICEEDRGKVEQISAGLANGKTARSVSPNRNLRKDGQVIWCEWYNSAITDDAGKMQSILSLVLDVTARKRAEEKLRESEEQFRALADSIPNLAWWANGDGYLTWYNRQWYEYTGTTPEQMEGWGWQSVHDPAMLPRVLERWKGSIASGEPFDMELPLRGVDGRFRWFLTRVMPVKDAAGKVVRWFGTNTDVTEQRQAREVLARSKAELEALVGERTAELRELVGELEHFSYSITHDMRAPLRAMMGFAEVVKELCSGSGQQAKVFLERIQTAARRMDLLITDALNYSKAVRSELPLAPMDVGRLLRGMVDTYPELQVAQGGIRVEPELPLVMGNEAGLTQCFSNLLVNAVKFAKPGEAPEVRVWGEVVADKQSWVRIWVEDRGIGIGRSMLPRVFDMFSRGTSEQAGTGIGLALVRKVVQRMGGRVGVESKEGRGSRFWVELRSGDVRGSGGA